MRAPETQTPSKVGTECRADAATNTNSVAIISGAAQADKTVDTLKARFALLGHELHVVSLTDGRRYFEVRRWGQARIFSTPHGVQAFLNRIGGAA